MNTIIHNCRLSFGRMLLVGIAMGLPFIAQAGEPASSQRIESSVAVSYADLDLTDPAGARTLYARLKRAAGKACGHQPQPLDLRASAEYQECYSSALDKAVKRVDSQQLLALHAEHEGQPA